MCFFKFRCASISIFQDGGTNLAELLSSALPSVSNRGYGKENVNLNEMNDQRMDLLMDSPPARSISDIHTTSSVTG